MKSTLVEERRINTVIFSEEAKVWAPLECV